MLIRGVCLHPWGKPERQLETVCLASSAFAERASASAKARADKTADQPRSATDGGVDESSFVAGVVDPGGSGVEYIHNCARIETMNLLGTFNIQLPTPNA